MQIGIPRETKPLERRVGATPREAAALVSDGHDVAVESGAGAAAGYVDSEYVAAGARIADLGQVWQSALIVKVKEVQPVDFPYLTRGQVVMGFMHVAENEARCAALLDRGVTALAYEYITNAHNRAPLVAPMSLIAGRLAVLQGASYLASAVGRGTLLAKVPGGTPAQVLLLGLGEANGAAAQTAVALGAEVTVVARDAARTKAKLAALGVAAHVISLEEVGAVLPQVDLLIAAVWQPGTRNPVLISKAQVATMPKGSVIIDITVDGGSPLETLRPTTLAAPTFVAEGVIHAAVPNMPAGVPRTASDALAAAALPYIRAVAGLGLRAAARADAALAQGILLADGHVTHAYVAAQRNRPLVDYASL